MIDIKINGETYKVEEGLSVIAACQASGVYIPSLCHHPDLPPFEGFKPADRVYRGGDVFENEPIGEEKLRDLEGCGL